MQFAKTSDVDVLALLTPIYSVYSCSELHFLRRHHHTITCFDGRMLLRSYRHVNTQVLFTLGRRLLHLAPPFLLDDYIPRYQLLSSIDAAKKRSVAYKHLENCNLCPRLCGVNRYERTGTCLIGAKTVPVSVIAPHFGEGTFPVSCGYEPPPPIHDIHSQVSKYLC